MFSPGSSSIDVPRAPRPSDGWTGDRLREERQARGLTQAQLADLAGFKRSAVIYWERRGSAPIRSVAVDRFIRQLDAIPTKPKADPAVCGARTRNGGTCRRKPVPGRRRCLNHGGLSTGPRTSEGRQRVAEARARRWDRYREALPAEGATP